MRVASRMRPEKRPPRGSRFVRWEHDGALVDSFLLAVDGVEYNLGTLTPVTGTTYEALVPTAVSGGPHDIVVYAVNTNGRSASMGVTITW